MRSLTICTFFCISVAFTFGNPGKFVYLCVCNYRVFGWVFVFLNCVLLWGGFCWVFCLLFFKFIFCCCFGFLIVNYVQTVFVHVSLEAIW